RELLGRLQPGAPAADLADSAAPAQLFVGRTAELASLRAELGRVARRPRIVVVEGESGVGKSALVQRFARELRHEAEPAPVVLAGACQQHERVPYKGLDGVVDALSRRLARMPPAESAALLPRQAGLLAQLFPVLARVEAIA